MLAGTGSINWGSDDGDVERGKLHIQQWMCKAHVLLSNKHGDKCTAKNGNMPSRSYF